MRLWLRHVLVAIPALLASACGNEEEIKKKVAEAEKKADDRVAQAQREARSKTEAVQAELDKTKQELTEAKSKLSDAVSQAQASVEEQTKAAEAAIQKARDAFKEEGRTELAHINKDVQEISSKSGKVPKASKDAFMKLMKDIQ